MKKALLPILICLLVFACVETEVKKAPNKKTEVKKTYYKNGKIKGKISHIKGTNIRYGETIWYYGNGKIRKKATYKDGLLITGKFYKPNGILASEVVDGNGKAHWYLDNGKIGSKSIYKNGKKVN